MNSSLALVLFYLLLAVATVVLRGDAGAWPRGVDRMVACLVCLGAVALLGAGWRSRHPSAVPAGDGSSRPRSMAAWWLALAAGMAFVFLVLIPPVSVRVARPLAQQGTAAGQDSLGPLPPIPGDAADLKLATPSGDGAPGEHQGTGSSAAGDSGSRPSLAQKLQSLWKARPLWLMVVLLALEAGVLAWWLRRAWKARQRAVAADGRPQPPWHLDPEAPAYVREFRRLCEQAGFPPRPGDTWRDLLGRLPALNGDTEPMKAAAAYHYRVRYEGGASDPAAEREFVRLIRALRKAATVPPATGTEKAASAAH